MNHLHRHLIGKSHRHRWLSRGILLGACLAWTFALAAADPATRKPETKAKAKPAAAQKDGAKPQKKTAAAKPAAAAQAGVTHTNKIYLGPLPAGQEALVQHDPYALDEEDCSMCHENEDPKNPGALSLPINEGCYECHEDMKATLALSYPHQPATEKCTRCHNPHESTQPALLIEESEKLCLDCHAPLKTLIAQAKTHHGALTTAKKCLNCHSPHGSKIEHILKALPFDLCMQCHATNNVVDAQGKTLINFETLLANNEEWHAPVAGKDCSACHNPHAGDHFRLLVQEYPAKFYSPFDPKLYKLCFECHSDQIIADPETTTQTQFRNGKRNLHYLHVNKPSRGRTCRACHDIHAAKQAHIIRDGVPYGSRGWILKLNYERTPTGGSCARTCHKKRSYDNTLLPATNAVVAPVRPQPADQPDAKPAQE